MEFNAVQQYRPTPNRSHSIIQPSSRPPPHMMYSYGSIPMQQQQQQQQQHQQQPQQPHQQQHQQQQQQSQVMHSQSRPSPPYPTWTVPHHHNPYGQMQNGQITSSSIESEHIMARTNVSASHSPAMSNATYRHPMGPHESLGTPDYFQGTVIDTSPWGQKVCEELESFQSMDPDMEFGQSLMGHDENTPIIDLRQYHSMEQHEADNMATFNPTSSRRMSESSFSISSTGGALPETSTYEEMGSSEAVSYASDCDGWNNYENAPSLLSPLASPRRPHHDSVVRTGSRSRASPAPHNNVRSSPYTMESSRFKRWSTGHAPTSTPTARTLANVQDRFAPYGPRLNPHHSMPAYPSSTMNNFQLHSQNVIYPTPHPLQSSNPTLFASPDQPYQLEVPRPLPSQGLFRLLQSNADRHGGCASHFADLSDPPDLYSSLHEEASNPPESDMNPSDPDLIPHEQDLRFAGDLYTPRWVRGHGNKREGWCGLCKPGRWLVLKNSAFWYDKSFTHGVSAATGAAFQGPQQTRRTDGNLDVWEGLCGSCGDWIALVSSKKKGTTWFRHAYKCHTHPKVKDGPKRRRETHTVRARAVSSASANSSSYPIKQDHSQDSAGQPQPQSTPTPSSAQLQQQPPQHSHHGMPITSSMSPASHALPTSSYPTPTSLQQPPPTSMPASHHADVQPKHEPSTPIMGMFSTPLQPMSMFSTSNSTSYPALPVSEPELVGVKTISPLTSLASMI